MFIHVVDANADSCLYNVNSFEKIYTDNKAIKATAEKSGNIITLGVFASIFARDAKLLALTSAIENGDTFFSM